MNAARHQTVRRPMVRRALVIPFPLARQGVLVKQLAAKVAEARTDEFAERVLQKRLAQLGRGLRAKKTPDANVDSQLRSLEAAVRAELWHLVFGPPTGGRSR
jgi:hypothetical protein